MKIEGLNNNLSINSWSGLKWLSIDDCILHQFHIASMPDIVQDHHKEH